jgi:hypothetical protein
MRAAATAHDVTGHLQVKVVGSRRVWFASWRDGEGRRRTRTLGKAHVKDTGRRTQRGAVISRAANGTCPGGAFTPKAAEDALAAIVERAREEAAPTENEPHHFRCMRAAEPAAS